MFIPQLVCLPGRVERIAEENQSTDHWHISRDVRGYTAAHGFAADNQPIRLEFRGSVLDYASVASLKFRLRIGSAASRFHVVKVELDGKKATRCKFGVEVRHERRVHSLACAVSEDNGRAAAPGLRFEDFK